MHKKVFVSGCYDLFHSGHVEFFRQAAEYGDLYVGIGSDATIEEYKHHKPMFPEEERLFMVKSVRYVKDAFINQGCGILDFIPTIDEIKPDVFVVNAEGGSDTKRKICAERGIEYVELERTPHEGLTARSSSALKREMVKGQLEDDDQEDAAGQNGGGNNAAGQNDGGNNAAGQNGGNNAAGQNGGNNAAGQNGGNNAAEQNGGNNAVGQNDGGNAAGQNGAGNNAAGGNAGKTVRYGIPTRLDLAGTWIDQPYVSMYHPGWALTISIEPTFEVRDRCGLSTSTRKMIQKIWPVKLPKMDPEMLARLVFCFENSPEREGGHISGAQDAIGICVPGLCRHYYDNGFWPKKIETCSDEMTLRFLEDHLVLIPLEPRRPGCSVVYGKHINYDKVVALAQAADDCWNAILKHDLDAFAAAYNASFKAQIDMFPAMVTPAIDGKPCEEASQQTVIDTYMAQDDVLAIKFPGAGGGGYLALVVKDAQQYVQQHPEAIELHIRRA